MTSIHCSPHLSTYIPNAINRCRCAKVGIEEKGLEAMTRKQLKKFLHAYSFPNNHFSS